MSTSTISFYGFLIFLLSGCSPIKEKLPYFSPNLECSKEEIPLFIQPAQDVETGNRLEMIYCSKTETISEKKLNWVLFSKTKDIHRFGKIRSIEFIEVLNMEDIRILKHFFSSFQKKENYSIFISKTFTQENKDLQQIRYVILIPF